MKRIIELILAGTAAILCVGSAATNFWITQTVSPYPPDASLWPLPALILIEVAVLGLAGFAGIVLDNKQHSLRWGILAWIACGGLTALAIIGAFSVSVVVLSAVPALLFGSAMILADVRRQRRLLADFGVLTVSAIANFTLLIILTNVYRI